MFSVEKLIVPNGFKFFLFENNVKMSWKNVFQCFNSNESFVLFFIELLKSINFPAYFFECIPINANKLHSTFEFVVINSDDLASKKPDFYTFAKFFKEKSTIVCFNNLGGDAFLIAPKPNKNKADFAHLANFIKYAESEQQQQFWKIAFKALEHRISEKSLWLSTSGLGVFWLHLRIDSYPKYYQYFAYKTLKP